MGIGSTLGARFKLEFVGRVIGVISGGLLIVLLARLLSPEEYGLLFLVLSVLGTVKLFTKLGIGTAVGKHIAEFKERDKRQTPGIIRHGFTITLVAIIVVITALLALRNPIADYFDEPAMATMLLVGTVFVVSGTLWNLCRKTLQGFEDIKRASALTIITEVTKLPIAIGFVLLGYGAVGALLGYTAGFLIGAAVGIALVYHNYYAPVESVPLESSLKRRIVRYAVPLTVTDSAHIIDKRVDTIIVGAMLGPAAVGFYNVGKQLTQFIKTPMVALGFTLAPTFESLKVSGDHETGSKILETALANGFMIYIPAAAGIILVADPFVPLVFGTAYEPAIPVVQLFGVYIVFLGITKITNQALDYLGRAKERAVLKVLTGVANAVLTVILIMQYGLIGAVIATIVTYGVYAITNLYLMTLEFDVRTGWLARHVLIVILITLVMAAVVTFGMGYVSGVPSLVAVIGTGLVIWATLSVATGILDLSVVKSTLF